MKLFRTLLIASFLLVSRIGIAQTFTLPQNELFKFIHKDTAEFANYGSTNYSFIDQPYQKTNTQQLVKIKNDIYILLNGTGQVYKSMSYDSVKIVFQRIDSTFYFGYNFDSFYNLFNGIIYSFGGYGYWKDNGHLRKFINGNDWQIIPLNDEVPFNGKRNLYHYFNGNLYWIINVIRNEGFINPINIDSCYKFNFNTYKVESLGKTSIKNDLVSSKFKIDLPFGVLIEAYFNNNTIALFDFENNVIFRQKRVSNFKLPQISENYYPIQFFRNGFIYKFYLPSTKIDSVKFDINDFEKTEFKIYEPKTKISEIKIWINTNKFWLILIILSVLPYFILFQKKPINNILVNTEPTNNFEIWEIELLKELLKIVYIKGHLSVEDFNLKLGINNKSLEVQKKTRNDFINSVNTKFRSIFKIEEDLILRERNEEDKRIYKYKVSDSNFKVISDLLKKEA